MQSHAGNVSYHRCSYAYEREKDPSKEEHKPSEHPLWVCCQERAQVDEVVRQHSPACNKNEELSQSTQDESPRGSAHDEQGYATTIEPCCLPAAAYTYRAAMRRPRDVRLEGICSRLVFKALLPPSRSFFPHLQQTKPLPLWCSHFPMLSLPQKILTKTLIVLLKAKLPSRARALHLAVVIALLRASVTANV
jgi:hypothetical protein